MKGDREPIWPYVVGVTIHVLMFSTAIKESAMGALIFFDVVFAFILYNKDK